MNLQSPTTAQLLLDLLSSWDPAAPDEVTDRVLKVVTADLAAIGAVGVEFDEEASRADIDLGELLGASTGIALFLGTLLARERGTSLHDVIVEARTHFTRRPDGA